MSTSKVLTVAGMHRSGTSLTANWLVQCGLNMGFDLLGNGAGNRRGHFEDKDFLRLHRKILDDNGMTYLDCNSRDIVVSEDARITAAGIIRKRSHLNEWGWKEPRSSLILDYWRSLMPGLKFIVVYRDYIEVADSILRREKQTHWNRLRTHTIVYSKLNIIRLSKLMRVWDHYNQVILDVVQEHPDDALVIRIDDLIERSIPLVRFLNNQWGFNLKPIDIKSIYARGMMQRHTRSKLFDLLYPNCKHTWYVLEAKREMSLARLND